VYILGIWDGHDAGASIIKDNKILVAINEERITRQKIFVGFPTQSIIACLNYLKLKPSDIEHISFSTYDLAKTLTRHVGILKKKYYLLRRRKQEKPFMLDQQRNFKYLVTEIPGSSFTKMLSKEWFKKKLMSLGFRNFKLHIVEHHQAHIAPCAFCSGMKKSLNISVDGIGDALSGSINIFNNNSFERIANISGRNSLGIFFEQVTTALGMRELEDEGKVMALADFAYPVSEEKNKMLDFFKVKGMNLTSKYSVIKQKQLLNKIMWNTSREQFAYMAQYTLQKNMLQLFQNTIDQTGIKNVSWTGGVASNVKVNMDIKLNSGLKNWFVFPHMGDGGLALGAAMQTNYELNGVSSYDFKNIYFGPEYDDATIKKTLLKSGLSYHFNEDISQNVGDLISKENIVLWFQGRMEYGPRALGNRSILASSADAKVKATLNKLIKRRSWFQPFCPSVLESEAKKYLKMWISLINS